MTTMVVLVRLKEGVSRDAYEMWVTEKYAPVVKGLPSVGDWRNHRVTGLLGSDGEPPFRYVVTLEVADAGRLGADMSGPKMRRLIGELHRYAEVTQLVTERFV